MKAVVSFRTKNGVVSYNLPSDTDQGSALRFRLNKEKRGGVTDASFYLPEGYTGQLCAGSLVNFFIDGALTAIFDIPDTPPTKGTNGLVKIEVSGVSQRLRKLIVQDQIENMSLRAAFMRLTDLASSIGISILISNIHLPTDVLISELSITDKTAFDCIELYITMANNYAEQDVFSWYVDNYSRLIVIDLRSLTGETVFEGYQFSSPKVAVSSSDLINSIVLYRLSNTTGLSEYVNTYTEPLSIALYGLKEQKKVLNYYAADTDCEALAKGLLAESAYPISTVTLSDIVGDVSWAKKRIMLAPYDRYQILFEGELITELNTAESSGVEYTTVTDAALGSNAIQCVVSSSASGFVEIPVGPTLYGLSQIRLWLKADSVSSVNITLVGRGGEEAYFTLIIGTEWALHIIDISKEDVVWYARALYMGDYALYLPLEEGDRALYFMHRTVAHELTAVRIAFATLPGIIWIDRVDALTQQWGKQELFPARISSELVQDALVSNVVCGKSSRTAESELTDIWKALRGI